MIQLPARCAAALRLAPLLAVAGVLALAQGVYGQLEPTTPRAADEGEGPFERLILRGATVVDGTGAPPRGPVDVVIEGDRIAELRSVGYPGVPVDPDDRPEGATREIDAEGMYVMPGFVDMHAHTGGEEKAPQPEYVYKLWMGHGITTSRGVPHTGFERSLREKALSARNEIVAPRMFTYVRPGSGEGWEGGAIDDPAAAREWVRWAASQEVEGQRIDGIKLGAYDPAIMEALVDEGHEHGLGTVAHLDQTGLARMTARDAARLGLDMMTHHYGLFESMLEDRTIQDWPADYNYNDEQDRFAGVAHLWYQSVDPGSEAWNALVREFVDLGFAIDPTLSIYEASRDVMRAREAEWHDDYTLPSLAEYFLPSRRAHGSYWFYWTTEDEYHWKRFYRKWMRFLDDFKDAGGIVTTGSDSGFIYKLYGFGYIRELELLREAGFHPLEVVRSATYHGARQLHEPKGTPIDFGILRQGLKADLVVVGENPLENLKVLYGTGAVRLDDETGDPVRVGGVEYTIKDGIVYDAKALLEDVRRMVSRAKEGAAVSDASGP